MLIYRPKSLLGCLSEYRTCRIHKIWAFSCIRLLPLGVA
jgi:hypothetical protein